MELFWSVARIGVTVYVGCILLVMFRQGRYVYYPDTRIDRDPSQLGMAYEDVELRTEDGETLGAWFVPSPATGTNATILLCHGNAGDIGDRVDSVRTFHDMHFNVLIFDYRGYGTSSGKPTEKGTYADVRAAWTYLVDKRGIPPRETIVFGRSLGGAVAAWLAAHEEPGMLVMESSFTSATDMAKRMFPILPVRWFTRFRYDSLARLKDVSCPVLVAHSRQDQMIPFEMSRRLFDAAGEPKLFVEFNGGHNAGGLDVSPEYQEQFKAFCERR